MDVFVGGAMSRSRSEETAALQRDRRINEGRWEGPDERRGEVVGNRRWEGRGEVHGTDKGRNR